MLRRVKKSNKLINQMNVVPYIDVMLVLLVIFMVTAPMFVPEVINLPSVGKSSQLTKIPIQINITKAGTYSITSNNNLYSITSLENLISQIKILANNDSSIVVSADKEVIYDSVIKVVDSLYTVGIKKVALVVKEKNG